MVGYLYELPEGRKGLWSGGRPQVEPVCVHGLRLLGAGLPPGSGLRQFDRGARALRKRGCGRVLTAPELRSPERKDILGRRGLVPIDPLPLCRAKAAALALALVEELPLRHRWVALRGENAQTAWPAASALCPQVGMLLLDFDWGEEELAQRLRTVYGAAALDLRQGPPPQVSVEFAPRSPEAGRALRLWGAPNLAGCALSSGGVDDPPLLTLLWETGRLELRNITAQWRDKP